MFYVNILSVSKGFLYTWGITCLYKVVADVGLSDHWQDVGLTPLHRLASPTEGIDQ